MPDDVHAPEAAPRISVVVAVHNPGPHFDDLIDSFLRQTLPPEEFEVLLCDDGSDEATQVRLDAVAAAHPHLKVLKLEHSGWPGTPRNAGIDAAAGKYVFFCDHDDRMGDEALQRLADYADENCSDVVVGKLVGVGRGVPRNIFRQNVPNAVLGRDPLLEILTPHKLFRTEFIRKHDIRFPDGKVRLEDHMFVMRSYFAAEVISILADYPVYYWMTRTDQPSASATQIQPEYYFRHMETVLDIVEENTEPGPDRDVLLQHWYRGKVLKRLSGGQLLRGTEAYRTEFLDVVRPLVGRRFPPALDQHLSFAHRVRSALLRAGRVDDLLDLARVEVELTACARATSVTWDGDRLRVEVEAMLAFRDGTELEFDPIPGVGPDGVVPDGVGPRWRWRPPVPLATSALTDDVLDAGRDLAGSRVEVFVRARHDGADYVQPVTGPATTPVGPGLLRCTVLVDPRTARAGRAVTAFSALIAQVNYAGWTFSTSVRVDPALLAAAVPAEHRIGRRAFTVATRGSDRMILTARRLPAPAPKPPEAPEAPSPPKAPTPPPTFAHRVVRRTRRIADRIRRGSQNAG